MAVVSTISAVPAVIRGVPIKIVAASSNKYQPYYFTVLANSSYKTITDLNGKSFGVTRPGSETYVETLLMAHNQSWTQGVNYNISPLGSLSAMVAGLKTNVIQALAYPRWGVAPLVNQGVLRSVLEQVLPWQGVMLVTSTQFIQQHPDVVRAAIAGLEDAGAFFSNPSNQAAVLSILQNVYALTPAIAHDYYTYNLNTFSTTETISLSGLQSVQSGLLAAKVINATVDVNTLYAPGFVSTSP